MKKKILVVGSSNTDMVTISKKLPSPGETLIAENFLVNPGGKGANQALASSRLGGSVTFVCKIGDDIFGKQAYAHFEKEGIDVSFIRTDPQIPSGVALINIDAKGENTIVVALGANANLNKEDVDRLIPQMEEFDIMLTQLETPLETVDHLAKMANKFQKRFILNPAPAQILPDNLLKLVDVITPNETEAEVLTNQKVTDEKSAKLAAQILIDKGVNHVIITMGAQGAYLHNDTISKLITVNKVNAIDTVAAGDTFNGALAVALMEGQNFEEAVSFANTCAAISVTRTGAQSSIPFRKEVN